MNIQVADQKRFFSILSTTSTDQTRKIAQTRFPKKSLNLLTLFFVLLLATGCGGNSSTSTPSPTPTPTPTPTASNGHFRALKSVTATHSLATIRLYDTSAPTSSMTYARSSETVTLLADGRVLVAGGSNDATGTYTAEVFDPSTETFSLLDSTMSWGRIHHCAVTLPDNRVVLVGGWAMTWLPVLSLDLPPTVDVFDPTTNTFSAQVLSGPLPDSTGATPPQCFLLSGNRAFFYSDQSGLMILDTNTWQTRALPWSAGARPVSSSVTQTPDGKVWIIGGDNPTNCTSTSDIVRFDPETESLSTVGQLLVARESAGILPFPDNSVEVYGGTNTSPLDGGCYSPPISSIERIDSAGNASKIGDLPLPKAIFTPVMLQNGKSLQVGGTDSNGYADDTQYVFDETTYISGDTGNMVEERLSYGITPLTTGRVFIVGGNNHYGVQSNTAEIFEPDASIYVLMPKTTVAPGEFMQLSAESATSGDVTWTANYGTITTTGGYTAPSENPNGAADPVTTVQDEVTATLSTGAEAVAPITIQFPASTSP
jgi:hypothetical protein